MAVKLRWLVHMFLLTHFLPSSFSKEPHRKFEYKYSFKPPYLAQRDGSVPFWEYGGNAIASSENVRIAPSLRSQKGAIWTKQPINFDWWEVDLVFRITGRGRIGADGLAFWYSNPRGTFNGTVFGSSDQWNGLGIFFDSFDNDNKHNNPYIMAILNDGTKTFDHSNDGTTQLLNGCLRDFRNKPFPTKAKIEYYQHTLSLLFHGGMRNNENDYEICFRVENVTLPKHGYFGISAATGGLADDHDVLRFLTTSLHSSDRFNADELKISSEEEIKLSEEYQNYQRKLEQQKEDYKREHPDEKSEKEDFDEWFESDNQRELRQIFLGQSQTFDAIKTLNNKLDEIVGKQEKTINLLSQIQIQGAQVGDIHSDQPLRERDSIQSQEVNTLLSSQSNILSMMQDVKSFISDVKSKTETILNNQVHSPTAQVQSLSYDYQTFTAEVRDGLNILKREIGQANTKIDYFQKNSPVNNCLSTTTFSTLLVVQTILVLIYNIYRNKKETQAKKFY